MKSLFRSVLIHLPIFLGLVLIQFPSKKSDESRVEFQILTKESPPKQKNSSQANTNKRHTETTSAQLGQKNLNLGINFLGKMKAESTSEVVSTPIQRLGKKHGILNEKSTEYLFTKPKVTEAFDRLAQKIYINLDYPKILGEFGVTGNSKLELMFDENGNINESASKFFGDNKAVRGLLVQAARKGIVDWYKKELSAFKLDKSDFRSQIYRADFDVFYSRVTGADFSRSRLNEYILRKRLNKPTCFEEVNGAVTFNTICGAGQVYGAVRNAVSAGSKPEYDRLVERLSEFDHIGLAGVNKQISSI